MFTIIQTLWRLMVLVAAAFLQAIAAILGGIALLFGKGCEALKKLSGRALKKLDHGKYEKEMRTIATE